jgi:hypothetical protein
MRDVLKNLFSSQITIEDNGQFYYTVTPFELNNPWGNVIAILQEYNFTKKDDNNGQFSCKLYKTKEGNWYDIEVAKITIEKGIIRLLKSAIDAKENDTILKEIY